MGIYNYFFSNQRNLVMHFSRWVRSIWQASWMGLNGEAAGAYDLAQIHAVERMAIDGSSVFAWFYPPALLLLKQQPWIVGVFVALLSFKPHMVVMFPLVFLLTRSWRAATSSMLSVLLLVLASIYLFGWPTWVGWQGGLQIARELNENGSLPWAKMPTVFAALRMQGTPIVWAYFGQLVSALVAICLMVRIWHRTNEISLRGSAFVLATLLISPHFFDYDLLWLALLIA